jgi:UDP-N-acetyl-D-glucosamine dehydrogenase
MTLINNLPEKFVHKQGRIGLVGLGYVGLPLAVSFAHAGFEVVGVDNDKSKIAELQKGHSYIKDIPSEKLAPLVANGQLRASTDYGALATVDAISICVPTPLRKTKDPDISFIIQATEAIITHAGIRNKLIVLESTTYPGTTEEVILPRLLQTGLKVGQDFFLAFSPERIDPGRTDYGVRTTPKVIGGITAKCLAAAMALYGTIVDHPVPVSNTATAEMVKLLENTFRAVNIGLVNEIALMCAKLGLNVWEVVDAAATKPYGFMPFYPGPGLGGHCIPIDPHYLSWKLRTLNYTARFIELAADINGHMPEYVVSRISLALNEVRKPLNGSRILILGVAYKPNVSDVRESPALDIIHLLRGHGVEILYNDPYVPDLAAEGFMLKNTPLTAENMETIDCVVIITDHETYDWEWIAANAPLIVDTRNALAAARITVEKPGKIYTL